MMASALGGEEVVARNHGEIAGIPLVRALSTASEATARGEEQAERYHPSATQKIAQFSELVATGMSDPNT